MSFVRSSPGGRGGADQGLQKEAKAPAVLPVQRCARVREHHHQ